VEATQNKAVLAGRDYVVLLDCSGSMEQTDGKSQSRWKRQEEVISSIATVAERYDPDGISVHVYTTSINKSHNNVKGGDAIVRELLAQSTPGGSTYTGACVKQVLDNWWGEPEATRKKLTLIVATDGETPEDDQRILVRTIIDSANRIKADEDLAITFLQVGTDAKATAFLKRLDDDLQKEGAKFDIVDFKTEEELQKMGAEAVLLAAIED